MIGWIYIATNPSLREGLVKVGYSERDPQHRLKEFNQAGLPTPYECPFWVMVEDAPRNIEQQAHRALHEYHFAKEWFECGVQVAAQLLLTLVPHPMKVHGAVAKADAVAKAEKSWMKQTDAERVAAWETRLKKPETVREQALRLEREARAARKAQHRANSVQARLDRIAEQDKRLAERREREVQAMRKRIAAKPKKPKMVKSKKSDLLVYASDAHEQHALWVRETKRAQAEADARRAREHAIAHGRQMEQERLDVEKRRSDLFARIAASRQTA